MKNSLQFLLILFSVSILADNISSNDLQTSNLTPKIMEKISTFDYPVSNREVPLVEFSQPPIALMESYYRYMIGGYKAPSILKQPAISQPGGYTADGFYAAFMGKAENSSERRIYSSYINNFGEAATAIPVSSTNLNEGFMSIDMDPDTANPLMAWHVDVDEDINKEVMFSYDLFNSLGTAGLWQVPYLLIDNPLEESLPSSSYIWPVLRIGPSPIEGKRRVHVFCEIKSMASAQISDCIYGYSDFYYDEIAFALVFDEWNYQTIPQFEEWAVAGTRIPLKDFVVSEEDGMVAFVGFTVDTLFAVVSLNYGESFDVNLFEGKTPVFNPQNQDGSYIFLNEDGSPAEVFVAPSPNGGHFNAKYVAETQSAVFLSAMGITTTEILELGTYLPAFFYPKIFRYDFIENEYSIVDIQTTAVFPPVFGPEAPWDLDGDGVVDSFDEEGNVEIVDSCPTFYFNGDVVDAFFHESLFKIATTESGQYQVAVFQDSRKHRKAYQNIPGFEDWLEVAEIAICVSNDFGETWSDPAYLNAKPDDENFYSELEGMYPSYIYPTEDIVLEGGLLKVPLLFLNDSVYGGHYNMMPVPPAIVSFAVLSIDPSYTFQEEENIPVVAESLTNYPNPFNPETKIEYEIVLAGDVSLEVFNTKGQKVRTLVNDYRAADSYAVTWNGKDNAGNSCSSGLYFYKLKTSAKSTVKKMVLMK